jgi:hypothetical protein
MFQCQTVCLTLPENRQATLVLGQLRFALQTKLEAAEKTTIWTGKKGH